MVDTIVDDPLGFKPDIYDYILSVDIGVQHLAFVLLEVQRDESTLHDIVWYELIDITKFQHLEDSPDKCTLPHTRTFADWLSHVFFLHTELFDAVQTILIERQPPTGFVVIEQLLFFHYRFKAVLVHPRSVHSWLGWGRAGLGEMAADEAYEERKRRSVQYFEYYLGNSPRDYLVLQFAAYERQHDVADAFCQAMFFLQN